MGLTFFVASSNITVTIVPYRFMPLLLENGWELVCFNPNIDAFRSTGDGSVVMQKGGNHDTRIDNGLPKDLLPKRGET